MTACTLVAMELPMFCNKSHFTILCSHTSFKDWILLRVDSDILN
jgi:hypothetical protein